MSSLRLLLSLIALLLLFGCSTNIEFDSGTESIFGETLVIDIPEYVKAWKSFETDERNISFKEWANPDAEHTDLLTTAIINSINQKGGVKLLNSMATLQERNRTKKCDITNLKYPLKSIYLTKYWEVSCIQTNGTPSKELNLGILGNDRLYMIRKLWLDEVSNEVLNQWKSCLERTYLCDTRLEEAPCHELQD